MFVHPFIGSVYLSVRYTSSSSITHIWRNLNKLLPDRACLFSFPEASPECDHHHHASIQCERTFHLLSFGFPHASTRAVITTMQASSVNIPSLFFLLFFLTHPQEQSSPSR